MEDNELVEAYRQGDESALGDLIDRYADRLFAFAYRLSGNKAVAEDATQDAFVKAWKKLNTFDARRSFKSWIFSITRNATIDILRARRDIVFAAFDKEDDDGLFSDTLSDSGPLQDDLFDRALEAQTLEDVISELPVDSRAVVILHDKEGLTFEEIGEALGEPLNTVKSRYRRAILTLRNKVLDKRKE